MSQMPRAQKTPPEVYRRRRIAALVVLVVIIGLIWAGVNAISSWLGASTSTPDVELPDGMTESNVVVEAGQPCPPGTVVVEARVGSSDGETKTAFPADSTPYIWFTLTNTNSVDCTFNAGAKVQFFTIQSGDQVIWKSAQCTRDDLVDSNIVLPYGETLDSPPVPWEKVFSTDSGCGVDQPPVITDGASYHLKVEVNGELSTNSQQFVLN